MVTPLLKKVGADPKDLKNFRPVSLLPLPAKILERPVTRVLTKFVEDQQLLHPRQAGFRSHHSTETIMLSVVDELRMAADINRPTALVLLDLSAAFDTVDHGILVHRVAE